MSSPGATAAPTPTTSSTPPPPSRPRCPPGRCWLFSGKTVHGGGANRTAGQWRVALHVSYLLGWLRSEEAHPFSIPIDVVTRLSHRARELLGFTQDDPAPHGGGRLWLVDFEDPSPLVDLATTKGTTQ